MARARFLLRPRWLLSHVLVALLVVLMVNLGFWQLRRLDEKRDRNDLIEARLDEPQVPVGDLVGPGDGDTAVEAARYRRVSATGTYDAGATVEVRNRSQDGVPGAWLVTPLVLEGGERVGVIRGFVGFEPDGSYEQAAAPAGRVTVTGLAMDPDRLGGTAGRDLEPLLAEDDALPAMVLAGSSEPPEPDGPAAAGVEEAVAEIEAAAAITPVPRPELDEGPHLSYAVQWFIFSAIGVVGYPLVLRRVVARRGREVDDDRDDDRADERADGDLDRELEELLRRGG